MHGMKTGAVTEVKISTKKMAQELEDLCYPAAALPVQFTTAAALLEDNTEDKFE